MSGPPKRRRLDDPAPSTEEQLAELLDRLRREQSSASSASPALNSRQTPRATTETIPTPTIQTPAHGHTSSANTTSTGAGRSAAPATEISSAAATPTNNLGTEGITAALAATLQTLTAGQSAGGAWQPNRGRGRGTPFPSTSSKLRKRNADHLRMCSTRYNLLPTMQPLRASRKILGETS